MAEESKVDPIAWLREVVESATPGPWEHHGGNIVDVGDDSIAYITMADSGFPDVTHERDARVIAALRNIAPALIAVVEAYRREAAARSVEETALELDGADCEPRSEGLPDTDDAIEQHALARSETRAAEAHLDAAIRAEMERQG